MPETETRKKSPLSAIIRSLKSQIQALRAEVSADNSIILALRDQLAMAAPPEEIAALCRRAHGSNGNLDQIAAARYQWADAMIVAKTKSLTAGW